VGYRDCGSSTLHVERTHSRARQVTVKCKKSLHTYCAVNCVHLPLSRVSRIEQLSSRLAANARVSKYLDVYASALAAAPLVAHAFSVPGRDSSRPFSPARPRRAKAWRSTLKRAPPQASFSSLVALPQVILRNTSGVVSSFSAVRVSRATHLPAINGSGLVWPVPLPSAQPQSLPNINLS